MSTNDIYGGSGESIEIDTIEVAKESENIVDIVKNVRESLEELNDIVTNKMGDEDSGKDISASWANEIVNDWKNYYTNDVPETLSAMEDNAKKLDYATQEAQQYSGN